MLAIKAWYGSRTTQIHLASGEMKSILSLIQMAGWVFSMICFGVSMDLIFNICKARTKRVNDVFSAEDHILTTMDLNVNLDSSRKMVCGCSQK